MNVQCRVGLGLHPGLGADFDPYLGADLGSEAAVNFAANGVTIAGDLLEAKQVVPVELR